MLVGNEKCTLEFFLGLSSTLTKSAYKVRDVLSSVFACPDMIAVLYEVRRSANVMFLAVVLLVTHD